MYCLLLGRSLDKESRDLLSFTFFFVSLPLALHMSQPSLSSPLSYLLIHLDFHFDIFYHIFLTAFFFSHYKPSPLTHTHERAHIHTYRYIFPSTHTRLFYLQQLTYLRQIKASKFNFTMIYDEGLPIEMFGGKLWSNLPRWSFVIEFNSHEITGEDLIREINRRNSW